MAPAAVDAAVLTLVEQYGIVDVLDSIGNASHVLCLRKENVKDKIAQGHFSRIRYIVFEARQRCKEVLR